MGLKIILSAIFGILAACLYQWLVIRRDLLRNRGIDLIVEEPQPKDEKEESISSNIQLSKKKINDEEITYYLPLVLERLVMGVESGLDIISAIRVVVEGSVGDPVTELFAEVQKLVFSGIKLELALKEVADSCNHRMISHAFLYIGLAHSEGGELSVPLRELCDTAQEYYQDKREEEISRMPVKATAPLLFIFAGVIVLMISIPLLELMEVAKGVKLR